MQFRNTKIQFGLIAKLLHWIIAFGLWGAFAFGVYIEQMKLTPDNFHLITWHKAFGVILLILILVRLSWRFVSPPPVAIPSPPKQHLAAQATHFMLYVLMITTPLFGWMGSSAGGYDVPVFGLFTAPPIFAESEKAFDILFQLHGISAFMLIGLSVLHIGAALYHHFILKNETLRRMLPVSK